MSNGWTAVFREITERTLGFAHGKTIVIFDLLSPEDLSKLLAFLRSL